MMRVLPTEEPLLPLDLWRQQMGLNPWHFWGLADQRIVPIESKCSGLLFEYDWQGSDAAGRSSLREAIVRAEEKLFAYVGYRPAPAYVEDTLPWPRYLAADQLRYQNLDATGRRIGLVLREGYVQAIGTELLTLLGTPTVAYSDQLNTGFDDTFTVTLPAPVGATPEQIAVYFSAADRDGEPAGARWRIQPVRVSIAAGQITITGRRWLVVRPVLYESPRGAPLDPTVAANFATTLEVYTRTTATDGTTPSTSQAALIYESRACGWDYGWCWCGGSPAPASTDPDATRQVVARAGIRDADNGIITPAAALYNADTGLWYDTSGLSCWYEPDRVTVRYLAGWPLESGQMARRWQNIVAILAAAEAKRRICACRETNERLHDLQQDLTLQATETERYQPSQEDLNCPFGTRRGHIEAWKMVRPLIQLRGIAS